ncbi:MAG: hypothetical protein ACT4PV_10020 [Planctomycetaceae bacterium]
MIRALWGVLLAAGLAAGEEAPHLALEMPPAGRVTVSRAIEEGVRFLVEHQNRDGSFGEHVSGRNYELWCDVPGGHMAFRAATTGLCYMGLASVTHQTEASRAAQARTLAWLVRNARVGRASGAQLYNVWAFAYGLRALALALRKQAEGAPPEAVRAAAAALVKEIEAYQSPDGGWGYYDFNVQGARPAWSTSFTSGTILIALHEAREAGIEVPPPVVAKGVVLMHRLRTPDDNYAYSFDWRYRPKGLINRVQGSSMRNQSCNLALALFDPDFTTERLVRGVQGLLDNHAFAIAGLRRPVPHESHYQVSGYFYLYGQMYAAMVLEKLGKEEQQRLWPGVVRGVLKTREPDGSFWDYPTYGYHKYYGTGYALMALARCPPAIAATIPPD